MLYGENICNGCEWGLRQTGHKFINGLLLHWRHTHKWPHGVKAISRGFVMQITQLSLAEVSVGGSGNAEAARVVNVGRI